MADIADKANIVIRVRRTRKREVLPDQETKLIAEVVERLRFVLAASPDAQHLQTGIPGLCQPLTQAGIGDLTGETAIRDPVRTADKHIPAINAEGKSRTFAIFIRLLNNSNLAVTD